MSNLGVLSRNSYSGARRSKKNSWFGLLLLLLGIGLILYSVTWIIRKRMRRAGHIPATGSDRSIELCDSQIHTFTNQIEILIDKDTILSQDQRDVMAHAFKDAYNNMRMDHCDSMVEQSEAIKTPTDSFNYSQSIFSLLLNVTWLCASDSSVDCDQEEGIFASTDRIMLQSDFVLQLQQRGLIDSGQAVPTSMSVVIPIDTSKCDEQDQILLSSQIHVTTEQNLLNHDWHAIGEWLKHSLNNETKGSCDAIIENTEVMNITTIHNGSSLILYNISWLCRSNRNNTCTNESLLNYVAKDEIVSTLESQYQNFLNVTEMRANNSGADSNYDRNDNTTGFIVGEIIIVRGSDDQPSVAPTFSLMPTSFNTSCQNAQISRHSEIVLYINQNLSNTDQDLLGQSVRNTFNSQKSGLCSSSIIKADVIDTLELGESNLFAINYNITWICVETASECESQELFSNQTSLQLLSGIKEDVQANEIGSPVVRVISVSVLNLSGNAVNSKSNSTSLMNSSTTNVPTQSPSLSATILSQSPTVELVELASNVPTESISPLEGPSSTPTLTYAPESTGIGLSTIDVVMVSNYSTESIIPSEGPTSAPALTDAAKSEGPSLAPSLTNEPEPTVIEVPTINLLTISSAPSDESGLNLPESSTTAPNGSPVGATFVSSSITPNLPVELCDDAIETMTSRVMLDVSPCGFDSAVGASFRQAFNQLRSKSCSPHILNMTTVAAIPLGESDSCHSFLTYDVVWFCSNSIQVCSPDSLFDGVDVSSLKGVLLTKGLLLSSFAFVEQMAFSSSPSSMPTSQSLVASIAPSTLMCQANLVTVSSGASLFLDERVSREEFEGLSAAIRDGLNKVRGAPCDPWVTEVLIVDSVYVETFGSDVSLNIRWLCAKYSDRDAECSANELFTTEDTMPVVKAIEDQIEKKAIQPQGQKIQVVAIFVGATNVDLPTESPSTSVDFCDRPFQTVSAQVNLSIANRTITNLNDEEIGTVFRDAFNSQRNDAACDPRVLLANVANITHAKTNQHDVVVLFHVEFMCISEVETQGSTSPSCFTSGVLDGVNITSFRIDVEKRLFEKSDVSVSGSAAGDEANTPVPSTPPTFPSTSPKVLSLASLLPSIPLPIHTLAPLASTQPCENLWRELSTTIELFVDNDPSSLDRNDLASLVVESYNGFRFHPCDPFVLSASVTDMHESLTGPGAFAIIFSLVWKCSSNVPSCHSEGIFQGIEVPQLTWSINKKLVDYGAIVTGGSFVQVETIMVVPLPSLQPSTAPTLWDTATVFCAVSNVPFTTKETEEFSDHVKGLNGECEFLIHLGNFKFSSDECTPERYDEIKDILLSSNVPVFIVLGDNEANDCPGDGHETGLELWKDRFLLFDKNWDHQFMVDYLRYSEENYHFVHKGTLFFGLNIVGGTIWDEEDWELHHTNLVEYVIASMLALVPSRASRVVMMFHAHPTDDHNSFFMPFWTYMRTTYFAGTPLLLLHGGSEWEYEVAYAGLSSVTRMQLPGGTTQVPLKITAKPLDDGANDIPFQFE